MKRIISVLLAFMLILSVCIVSASADDAIIDLNDEDAEEKITERISPGTTVNVVVFPDYPGPDFAENNAVLFEKISAVIPSAQRDPKYKQNGSSMLITMPADKFIKLKEVEGIYDAMLFVPSTIPVNDDGTVDIMITYGYNMTAVQQKQYNDADWEGKMTILRDRYAESKVDLLEAIGMIGEYQVIRDTSINQIYLRVPAVAVDEIKKLGLVKKCINYTLPASKLNKDAQKLIDEADPATVVRVWINTDRGDIVSMRDYLNMNKQEINQYFNYEDEDGVCEYTKIVYAYNADFNRALIAEIEEKTGADYLEQLTVNDNGEVVANESKYANILSLFSVNISVGKLETLSKIGGIAAITYEPPKDPDPDQYWIDLGGDQDLARKLFGEPNENGWYYAPPGSNSWAFGKADEEEYKRFKEIDYVKGVIYCRPAPADGWWKLEGDPNFLKATYGEPNEDGRYYVPKKAPVSGDVDYDYDLTILDATAIQRELAELGADHFNAECADYDGDGDMTILDATAIQRTLVDL